MQVREQMPKAVQQFIADAQKSFAQLEGKARTTFQGTYEKVLGHPTVKKVEERVSHLRKLLETNIDTRITPLRKKVEKFSNEIGSKAFETVGVATKADIKAVTRKLNRLRDEVRKLTGGTMRRRRGGNKKSAEQV